MVHVHFLKLHIQIQAEHAREHKVIWHLQDCLHTPEAIETYNTGLPAGVSHEVCAHTHAYPAGNTSVKAWWGMVLSTDRSSEIKGIEVWAKKSGWGDEGREGEIASGRLAETFYLTGLHVMDGAFPHATYEQSLAKPASTTPSSAKSALWTGLDKTCQMSILIFHESPISQQKLRAQILQMMKKIKINWYDLHVCALTLKLALVAY